ncbi:MAG: hypothetical protein OEW42_06880 [Acidimicrobiia bacterium]|nr:hypothetical protein [Acidimicrobiia bacterium]
MRSLVGGLCLIALLVTAAPSGAQGGSGFVAGDPGVYAGYTDVTMVVTAGPGGVGGGTRRWCVLADQLDLTGPVVLDTIVVAPVEGNGYWVVCRYPDDPGSPWQVVDFVFYTPGDPAGGNVVTPYMVQEFAVSLFDLTAPEVALSPPADAQVVGVETWIGHPPGAVGPQARFAAAGPMWAAARAEPVRLSYDMGDGRPGSVVVCVRPAPVFDPGVDADAQRPDCGRYIYAHSSLDAPGGTWPVTTTVTYAVTLATESQPVPQFDRFLVGETAVDPVTVTDLEAVIH